MELREIPGTKLRVSVVGVSLSDGVLAGPSSWTGDPSQGLLRVARRAGVTLFDVSSSIDPQRAELFLRNAFPEGDRNIVVAVKVAQPPSDDPTELQGASSAARNSAPEGTVADSLRESSRRLGKLELGVAMVAESNGLEQDSTRLWATLSDLVRSGVLRAWGVRFRSEPLLSTALDALRAGASIVAVPHSLLRPSRLLSVLDPNLLARVGVFADDPHDRGRLNGRLLGASLLERALVSRPPTVRQLSEDLRPVLRLGFLTEGKKRTLGQAAVQFALRSPSVVSVLLPSPSPELLEEVSALEKVPDLTPAELEKIGVVPFT